MISIKTFVSRCILLLFCGLSSLLIAQENTSILCSDGIDNDGDGLIDCDDQECINIANDGCRTCGDDGTSFADVLIDYVSGCVTTDDLPEGALGVADYDGNNEDLRVFLGEGGIIKLGFLNNLVVNSGDNLADIFVFEVGFNIEPINVALRPSDAFTENQLIASGFGDINGDGFYAFTSIGGATSSIDIDALMPGYISQELKFNAIELMDLVDMDCGGSTPGADIDAVCALTNLVTDCAGVINGTFILDECGVCLEPTDPNYNMSCLDCAGVINGTFVDDRCGQCLDPNNPDFDGCVDCAGTINGIFIVDSCGVCLEPTDPNIDMSCRDCSGIINGTMIVDLCGVCLELNDPAFNISCTDCAGAINGEMVVDTCGVCTALEDPFFNLSCVEFPDLFIPNVFTPNGDGLNDYFQVYHSEGVSSLLDMRIYNRWGDIVFSVTDLPWPNAVWWDGTYREEIQNTQVYIYYIEALFINGRSKSYAGDVTVLR